MLKLTTIDGKLYGVGLGLNSFSMFFDTVEFEKAGIPLPTPDLTWDEYAKLAVELAKSSGKGGGPYAARYAYVFDAWLRQRGKSLFARESVGLGFTADDAKEWFDYWEKLRKAGGTVAADVQTLDQNTIDTNCLGLGKSVIGMAYSNQMVGYQLIIKNKLGITMHIEKISEIIAHFIGLFEMTTDEMRLRTNYAEGAGPGADGPALPDQDAFTAAFSSDLQLKDYDPGIIYKSGSYDIEFGPARHFGRVFEESLEKLAAIAGKDIPLPHFGDPTDIVLTDEPELTVFAGPGSAISHGDR